MKQNYRMTLQYEGTKYNGWQKQGNTENTIQEKLERILKDISGQEIEVFVKSLDKENKKISLGYKKAEDNPWEILRRDYPVDTVIESTIVGMTTFGAFATVIPGIDGLIHISQIADRHISKPQDVLKAGDKVTAKITGIDFDKKRVSLSIRALLPVEEKPIEEQAEETTGDELVYSTDAPEEFAAVVEQIDKAADETEE